ncbi:trypsin-like peptidase domain-containing protein [Candidatus Poribacteria bacterium]|nr:trypsin-like peptidase domain-containing protein [Candidatus Poribacteria bacterium]
MAVPQTTIIALLLFCIINTAPAQTTLPAEDIAEKALAATVYLEMKDKNGKTLGIGSGFFVKFNIIATNYHVIEGAAKGTAKLVGKNTTYNIEGVTATDKTNDLALLKVTAFGIKPLSLGDSDKVRIGETVYVAGNPKGLEGTFSDGIISSRRDKLTKERLQMTAPISPGSSGGPVLNRKGEVIGVSVAGHPALDAQNLNFAIPSKYLKALLEQKNPAKPLSQGKQSISADTYLQWGFVKYELGNYWGAILDCTRAILLKPDYVEAYHVRGYVKHVWGDNAGAIADYTKAIRLKPDYAIAYYDRGNVKFKLGQYAAAITDFDITIRLKPDYAKAYAGRGVTKALLDRTLEAKQDLRTALRFAIKAGDANLKTKVKDALRILNE